MIYWFKRKWRQIKRVWDFLPIIWRGYDWDYRYAVELFQHQLKRTANYIDRDGHHVGNKNTARRIRTAVDLLEKVYDEEYQFEYQSKIEEKYGPSKMEYLENYDDDYLSMEVLEVWEEDYTEEEQLIIKQEQDSEMWESREKQRRAHKLVWEYIEHNIRNWWD